MSLLLLAVVVLPALLAPLVLAPGRAGSLARSAAPWTALPALLVALVPRDPFVVGVEWLMLGTLLGLDGTGQVFLLLTAFLWLVAGVYARGYLAHDGRRGRYFFFHLLTLTGNLGLVVAHDLVGFYLFFALMTFAAYGLVVHAGSAEALRAGKVYIVMAVVGEALLLIGLLLAASGAPTLGLADVSASLATHPRRDLVIGLCLAGFGIKAGAVPLHVWLPLAHPVAPTPASAVLSGSMIKAGLLGWLRFLPLGSAALPGWSATLIALGLAAAFFGVAIGVTQRDPKTVLAYSSISQMGFLNMAVGFGLADPARAPVAITACLVYAVHHGLAKGALFLGVGIVDGTASRARLLSLAALGFTALAVAGAPLTSGSAAKYLLKDAAPAAPGGWPQWLDALLPLAAVGTTLLMGRFLVVLARRSTSQAAHPAGVAMVLPWTVLLLAVGGVVWLLPAHYGLDLAPPFRPDAGTLWIAIWPVLAGALLFWMAVWASRRFSGIRRFAVEPGDLLLPIEGVARRVWWARKPPPGLEDEATPVTSLASRWYGLYAGSGPMDRVLRWEIAMTRLPAAALFTGLLVLGVFLLLMPGRQ